MRTKFGVMVAALGLFCVVAPAVAHHGFDTEYDANKKFKHSGVVKAVLWTNPHMRVHVDVTDASGKVTTYNMEITSPNSVQRQGWGRNSLDRKSTRLNSSHSQISYAVFCLKKKNVAP